MAAHLTQQTMVTALAAGATTQDAMAAGHATSEANIGAGKSTPMHDLNATRLKQQQG